MRRKYYSQPRIVGSSRLPVGSSFIPDLEEAVRLEMRRYGVSRSFVIATAVAFALNIEEQADYHKVKVKQKRS